jgi:hypothetical protein
MGHLCGIVLPKETGSEDRFSLVTAPGQRGRDISWMGTRGLDNFKIHFSIEEATGQVWFLLRSNSDRGDNIRVGFFDGKVVINEQLSGEERLLGMTDWPLVFPWTGTIQLSGSELCLTRNGQTIMVSQVNRRPAHRSPSMLQMMVYDQLYGAARARNVSIEITPLLSLNAASTEGPR